jgi:HAE1 family hydrophobic/amphiphilic exporter-1
VRYSLDIADSIRDDYAGLSRDAILTIILVFVAMFLYIGLKDAIISTIFLPLAFFSTFFILYMGGYSLNFLTNFSLVLSFGIAIDTIIVILQGSAAKMRLGYNPKHAVILALQEYAIPILAGVLTNIVAFIPMMSLPGVLGKYLAYIPITIFCVLATGLVFALTVNSALYLAFAKKKPGFIIDDTLLEFADEDEKELLFYERQGKYELKGLKKTLRIRVLEAINHGYKNLLSRFLQSTTLRIGSIIVPLLFLLFTMFVFPGVGRIGFELFPSKDNPFITVTIQGAKGERTEVLAGKLGIVDPIISGIPEVKFYTLRTLNDAATLTIELYKTDERKAAHQRTSFEVESYFMSALRPLQEQGLKVESKVLRNGPPTGKPVGVKIVSKTSGNLDTLIRVSRDFEKYLKSLSGAKNVSNTSADTP